MPLTNFFRRLAHLFRRDQNAADLADEMRFHVELRDRKLRQQGVPDSRHAALRQFGNAAMHQDAATAVWGWNSWERLLQDVSQAFRSLRKSPNFAAVAVLTLALGLGMNTAIFSVVNAVMLRALPYPEPGRLLSLWEEQTPQLRNLSSSASSTGSAGGLQRTTVSVANLQDYRRHGHVFSGLASYALTSTNLTGIGTPERIFSEAISADFLSVLGVEPARGRGFTAADDRPDGQPVAIVTDDFWERRLGGDPGVLDRSILLDAVPHRIVGVLPRGFQSPAQLTVSNPIEVYVPAAYSKQLLASHGDHEVNVLARLEPGASVRTAQADLDIISADLARQYPDSNRGMRAVVATLQDDLASNVRTSLLALLGASGFIVLITCANVANLLLVRAIGRRHETSVRFALGASRLRIVRQFLLESMIVAAMGCLAGVALGTALMRLLIAIAPRDIPMIRTVEMDWRVFAVAAGIATLTGVVFGMAPAWQASQTKASESLKTAARNTGAQSQVRWRTVLTIAEVALSVVLLIGAGLLLKSFVVLMGVDLGFQPERVLAMKINLPAVSYATKERRLQFFQQLESRVQALPGVQSVAFANQMPMRGGWGGGIFVDSAPDAIVDCDLQAVSPGYFAALGIPLVRGRNLSPQDRSGQPLAAVVNQAFVRQVLKGADPTTVRLKHYQKDPWISIVGVVGDIRRDGKLADVTAEVYFPAAATELYPVPLSDLAVRTSGDPHLLVKAVQNEVWSLDKDLAVTRVQTLREIIDLSLAQRRFRTLLLIVFATVAVGLAMIGLFSVLSYSVRQRTNELGIRIALGARPGAILTLVLKQAAALVAAGVAIGLAGAWALTRYVESLLFQVQRHDWTTYAAAVALLAATSVAAALVPARRGAKVDPIVALRWE
jgi:putative ABC transport system permease protein